ncbi:hypothetical protein IC757_07280 [Wenzhouxiangella sp. AB-CW3]|uniref:hypothetical protein n=1 Tax=Wenzhouxiangella sp. AB-CW3 TaxID=2771012 RepID=UPI00168BB89B|nr:hypothetical protein [Wenzhouxiangella sp. AB-CW3]QOC23907.1 hypothetical protein IC757_07280 [Wenzhouxiangella sp. AB-CW3]
MSRTPKLLWVDCTAAALAGIAVVALSGWLSRLHLLPQELLVFIGLVNLLYGTYSFTLVRLARRPLFLIKLLAFANAAWAITCLGLATAFWHQASVFGLAHLAGEAIFVGWLAAMEWNQRHQLARSPDTIPTTIT